MDNYTNKISVFDGGSRKRVVTAFPVCLSLERYFSGEEVVLKTFATLAFIRRIR